MILMAYLLGRYRDSGIENRRVDTLRKALWDKLRD